MSGSSLLSTRRLALAGVFAGLAWGAGYLDSIPNFEFLSVILFAGGWALGPLGGAAAGALGEFLYSAINPYGSGLMHPLVLASQIAGMALAGAAGGWVGRLAIERPTARWLAVVGSGVAVTMVFDALTNLASGVVYGQWKATLIAAIPFAFIHLGTNAALFATAGVLLTRALERTRRSLAPGVLVLAGIVLAALGTLATFAPGALAQSAAPTPGEIAHADSAHADSVAYRDQSRGTPPPWWGEGPTALLRRDDGSLSRALTLEGGVVERWADDRGSAEPLGRFGIAGANRLLVRWLGMPLTGVGAVGGETVRVPWPAVAAMDAPRLPVSATSPYRGELGSVELTPWRAVPGHPRVTGWAGTGEPSPVHNGFLASARARQVDAFLTVEAASLAAVDPLGLEGDHGLAGQVRWTHAGWSGGAAYRSSQESIESLHGRFEHRRGEAGLAGLDRKLGTVGAGLSFERTADSFVDEGDLVGLTTQRGRGGRVSVQAYNLPAENLLFWHPITASLTYGRETLESDGNVPFDRRAARFWWVSMQRAAAANDHLQVTAAMGVGGYGGGKADAAPSLLLAGELAPHTGWWAGAARGLSAAPDERSSDALGDPLPGDPPIVRSSTWLGGIGVIRRSADQAAGGSWRGAAPRGALRARGALYFGHSSPGGDPTRYLFAGEAIEHASLEATGEATRFVALVMTTSWTPRAGLTIGAGGHAIGRRVDAALAPSDPQARAFVSLEERHVFGDGAPDARVGVTGEWIGPRSGTPAGDLPAAWRADVHAGALIDEFELRATWGNRMGSNRLLPLLDPGAAAPFTAGDALLRIEIRWTFWD